MFAPPYQPLWWVTRAPMESWKMAAKEKYFASALKNWRSTLDKAEKLVIIEVDGLASSLFRPRRFASPRAAGFLFSLPDFGYNHGFPWSRSSDLP